MRTSARCPTSDVWVDLKWGFGGGIRTSLALGWAFSGECTQLQLGDRSIKIFRSENIIEKS
jgi:hypothetical protein